MGSSLHEFISNQHGFKSLRRLNFFSRPYFHYSLSSFPYFRRSLSYFFVKVSSSTQAKSPSFIHMSRFASQSLKNICISFNKMIVCLLESNKKPQSVFFLPQSNKFSTLRRKFNEFTFISEKHRIIFVRRGIPDRSSRQHLHKIIKQNQ